MEIGRWDKHPVVKKNEKKLFHWSSRRGLGLDKKIRILRGKGWPTLDQMFAAGKK